nr:hypothetical protein [Sicyoidochytrium minutum DNA virus]
MVAKDDLTDKFDRLIDFREPVDRICDFIWENYKKINDENRCHLFRKALQYPGPGLLFEYSKHEIDGRYRKNPILCWNCTLAHECLSLENVGSGVLSRLLGLDTFSHKSKTGAEVMSILQERDSGAMDLTSLWPNIKAQSKPFVKLCAKGDLTGVSEALEPPTKLFGRQVANGVLRAAKKGHKKVVKLVLEKAPHIHPWKLDEMCFWNLRKYLMDLTLDEDSDAVICNFLSAMEGMSRNRRSWKYHVKSEDEEHLKGFFENLHRKTDTVESYTKNIQYPFSVLEKDGRSTIRTFEKVLLDSLTVHEIEYLIDKRIPNRTGFETAKAFFIYTESHKGTPRGDALLLAVERVLRKRGSWGHPIAYINYLTRFVPPGGTDDENTLALIYSIGGRHAHASFVVWLESHYPGSLCRHLSKIWAYGKFMGAENMANLVRKSMKVQGPEWYNQYDNQHALPGLVEAFSRCPSKRDERLELFLDMPDLRLHDKIVAQIIHVCVKKSWLWAIYYILDAYGCPDCVDWIYEAKTATEAGDKRVCKWVFSHLNKDQDRLNKFVKALFGRLGRFEEGSNHYRWINSLDDAPRKLSDFILPFAEVDASQFEGPEYSMMGLHGCRPIAERCLKESAYNEKDLETLAKTAIRNDWDDILVECFKDKEIPFDTSDPSSPFIAAISEGASKCIRRLYLKRGNHPLDRTELTKVGLSPFVRTAKTILDVQQDMSKEDIDLVLNIALENSNTAVAHYILEHTKRVHDESAITRLMKSGQLPPAMFLSHFALKKGYSPTDFMRYKLVREYTDKLRGEKARMMQKVMAFTPEHKWTCFPIYKCIERSERLKRYKFEYSVLEHIGNKHNIYREITLVIMQFML